jgi:hypothetical protein
MMFLFVTDRNTWSAIFHTKQLIEVGLRRLSDPLAFR